MAGEEGSESLPFFLAFRSSFIFPTVVFPCVACGQLLRVSAAPCISHTGIPQRKAARGQKRRDTHILKGAASIALSLEAGMVGMKIEGRSSYRLYTLDVPKDVYMSVYGEHGQVKRKRRRILTGVVSLFIARFCFANTNQYYRFIFNFLFGNTWLRERAFRKHRVSDVAMRKKNAQKTITPLCKFETRITRVPTPRVSRGCNLIVNIFRGVLAVVPNVDHPTLTRTLTLTRMLWGDQCLDDVAREM